MIAKASMTAESWRRLTRWGAGACLFLLALAWPSPALAACPGQSFPCDWDFKRKLTFNNAGQLENLVNVPVLVVLNSSRIDYSQTQNAGQDLRFTDSDGTTLLAHEIEKWDEAGTSYVWVKVPQIDGSSTTDHIWMFYGNPTAPDGQNPTAVWSNGYVGVWHLSEASNTTRLDSTSNNNDLTDLNTVAATAGKIGDAAQFVAANSEGLYRTDATQTGLDPTGNLTFSVWANPTTIALGVPLSKEESATVTGYRIRLNTSPTTFGCAVWNNPASGSAGTTTTPVAGTWYHITCVYNGSQIKNYLNGVNEASTNYSSGIGNSGQDFQLGKRGSSQYFNGVVDEARVETVERSGDWIKAQYLSMTDAYITYGSQEAVSCPPPAPFAPCNWQKRRKLTFNNAAQAENLVNVPVLVVLNSSRIDYGQTQNAGQDLRFTDSDGVTLLAHEIEKWDETGTSYVWVKVPQIDASSNTDYIWMYYGNATAPDGQDPGAVWSNGYAGVWHLKEPSNGTRSDSTCNANNLSDVNTVAAATGKIAGAADFIAANTEYLTISDAAQTGLDLGATFTLEGWVKATTGGSTRSFLSKHGASPNGSYNFRWGGSNVESFVVSLDGTSTNDNILNQTGNAVVGTWYYWVATYDGTTMRLYIDGAFNRSQTSLIPNPPGGGPPFNSTAAFNIGGRNNGTQPFNGTVDEGRVSNVTRSAAWISAQHKSMTDTFITFGTEGGAGASVSYYSPDAAAAGMHVPVTFVGSFCAAPTVTTSSSDIVVGPSILTDATGAVVTQDGKALSTMFFVKPDARPKTGITVTVDGTTLSQTFDLVIPRPDLNVTGSATLSGRTKRGTAVLGGLTVGAGGTLTISKTDTDGATAGNQGYLPAVVLVKGDVNIAGTVDVKGQDGTNGGASCAGGTGGAGGPGGGGGGGGGVQDGTCSGGSGTVDVRISTGTDDAEQFTTDGNMNLGGSDPELDMVDGGAGNPKTVGLRFQNITIPQGAAITNAYVEFTANDTQSNTVHLTFQGEAIDDAPTFTTADWNISTRTTTSASVAWNNVPTWNIGLAYQTPNLSAIIEEIVGRSGWVSGNDLVIIVTGTDGDREAKSYDQSSATAPLLHVDYGQSGGSTAAPAGAGFSGGGGGGSKGTGTGGAGGDGTNAAGAAGSGTTGGGGGTAMGGATGGGGGMANTQAAGGDGGGGGTGDPFGTGGTGASTDGATGGKGGGGGGASDTTPGGGAGGGFATTGARGSADVDAGYGGDVNGNAQLVPLAGGSGGAGGAPDVDITSAHRGGGGGGAGGAIQIYATGSVTLTGTITATGGNGGNGYTSGGGSGGGGGGSGGAILLQSGKVTATGTLTTPGGTGGSGAAGGGGGSGRIRIDGLESGSVPGTAGSKFIGPVIDKLVGTNVTGRADGGATVTLYVYDQTGAQVSGSPYTTSASGSSGTVGTWTISSVTFPSGTGYLAVKQSSGSIAVLGPGRASKGLHLINWREVY